MTIFSAYLFELCLGLETSEWGGEDCKRSSGFSSARSGSQKVWVFSSI